MHSGPQWIDQRQPFCPNDAMPVLDHQAVDDSSGSPVIGTLPDCRSNHSYGSPREGIIGSSTALRKALELALTVAATNSSVRIGSSWATSIMAAKSRLRNGAM